MEAELIRQTHHVDSDEPDESGFHAYYYEYDALELKVGSFIAGARTYVETPESIALLDFTCGTERVGLGDVKKSHLQEVEAIVLYLRAHGYKSVQWGGGSSYVEVPF